MKMVVSNVYSAKLRCCITTISIARLKTYKLRTYNVEKFQHFFMKFPTIIENISNLFYVT